MPTSAVFSRSDARACGWSDSSLARAVGSGRVVRIRRDQFAVVDPAESPLPEWAERRRAAIRDAVAAQRSCAGSVVSHRSAALIHGLPLLDGPPDRPDLTVQPRCTGDVAGALLHRASMRPSDIVEIDGVPVLSAARTVVDLARSLSMPAAVVTADAALFKQLATAEAIIDVRDMCRAWPGMRRARRAITRVDGRSESPLESISRLAFENINVPKPHLQTIVVGEFGVVIARLDFYWDDTGVAGEADGREKYTDRGVLTAEKERQEGLEDPGLVVTRWGWREALRPILLERKVNRALDRGRRRDDAGIARRWRTIPTSPLIIPW